MRTDLAETTARMAVDEPARRDRCAYCGDTQGPFHLDHVVPRSRGGPDTPSNLVKACVSCNCSKRDRLPSEWLAIVPIEVAVIERNVSSSVAVTMARGRDPRWGRSRIIYRETLESRIRDLEVRVDELESNFQHAVGMVGRLLTTGFNDWTSRDAEAFEEEGRGAA